MRDPAVLAVFALHLTAAEFAAVLAGVPIVRHFWPPVTCREKGLAVDGALGMQPHDRLAGVQAADGGCRWSFGPVTRYRCALPHVASRRAMASPMPEAPPGTLTPARDWDSFK